MKRLRTYAGLGTLALALSLGACQSTPGSATKEIQTYRGQDMVVALLNEKGELAMGQNRFIIAFRSAATNQPVDAGTVTVGSSMSMPGMTPMTASLEIEPTGTTGQYVLKGGFGMSGSWKFDVSWDGPAGRGTATFHASVR